MVYGIAIPTLHSFMIFMLWIALSGLCCWMVGWLPDSVRRFRGLHWTLIRSGSRWPDVASSLGFCSGETWKRPANGYHSQGYWVPDVFLVSQFGISFQFWTRFSLGLFPGRFYHVSWPRSCWFHHVSSCSYQHWHVVDFMLLLLPIWSMYRVFDDLYKTGSFMGHL